jgi:hypothetical protein
MKLLRQVLHVLLDAEVALQRGDFLLGPAGKRVRAGGYNAQILFGGQLHHHAAQPLQFATGVGRGSAYFGADLQHALVQFRLDLAEHQVVFLQNLRDIRAQLARFRVDDLVLFFDADGETGRIHEKQR